MASKFGGIRASNVLSYQSSSYVPSTSKPEPNPDEGDEGYSIAPTINLFTSPKASERELHPVDPFADLDGINGDAAPSADELLNDLDAIERQHGGYIKASSYGQHPPEQESKVVPMPNNAAVYKMSKVSAAGAAAPPVLTAAPSSSASSSSSYSPTAAMKGRGSRAAARQRASEDIKIELEKVEAERAALSEAQRRQDSLNNAVQNDLLQQKEELRQMMETIRLEKKEMALRYELEAREKEEYKLREEEVRRQREDNLHEALEVLRAQNQMLANRIEEREEVAHKRLEEERRVRQAELSALERRHKQMADDAVQAQIAAESKLSVEREELRLAMKKMELEKQSLADRISQTEEAARQDAVLMEMQKKEFHDRVNQMEIERENLKKMVTANEARAVEATEETAKQLKEEREATLLKLKRMEDERADLVANLKTTEEQVKSHAETLAQQLAAEKEELAAKVASMEKEKLDLAQHLMSSEQAAQHEATKISEAVRKEKEDLKKALEQVEQGKIEMLSKMAELEAEHHAKEAKAVKAAEEAASEAASKERGGAADAQMAEAAVVAAARAAEDKVTEKIRGEMEAKFEEFAKEKAALAAKLARAEEAAMIREKQMAETMVKEREELQRNVAKMKQEFLDERRAKLESDRAEQALAGGHAGEGTQKVSGLIAKRSLYDLLGESKTASGGDSQSQPAPLTHDITTVAEADDEEDVPAPGIPGSGEADHNNQPPPVPPELEGLPAPHTAAAIGDLRRLKSLADLESSLLSSFDTANRSPLFYAVAYNQPDAAAYLLNSNPAILLHSDGHGDTALHAASSTGSVDCLEVLLQASQKQGDDRHRNNMSVLNGMNMTPAHLALNREVLSLLAINGADLSAADKNGRSPLFIACAMNRADCAEFLIDALDHDEASLYEQDARGDTPLHAAACNGAVDCVLLLLQYGVDPRITNKKELKAIDLALRNKQDECREILAEYHLHFCTSSAFDSVLFLATLEGHKQVKHSISGTGDGADGEGSYQIIKVTGNEDDEQSAGSSASHPTEAKKQMKTVQSMFSLKKNRSLRLQRWGSWIAYEDQDDSSKVYWYNHRTNEGQWELPPSVKALQGQSDSKRGLASKASMRLKRMGDWIQYMTESNNTFYYNEKTGEFQWATPNSDGSAEGGSGGAGTSSGPTTDPSADPTRTSDWKPYKDPDTGGIFWYNARTQVSQWECPFTAPASAQVPESQAREAREKDKAAASKKGSARQLQSKPSLTNAADGLSGATAGLKGASGDDMDTNVPASQGSPERARMRAGENPFLLEEDDDEAFIVEGNDDLGI